MDSAPNLVTTFVSETRRAFAFVVDDWGFLLCNVASRSLDDPRDAHTTLRYFRGDKLVEVSMDHIALGLFVSVGTIREPVTQKDCSKVSPEHAVNFEHFLLWRHSDVLKVPLKGMAPHKTFLTMYNKAPYRYVRVIAKGLPAAVSELANRFKTYGSELMDEDLSELSRQLRTSPL